jgi:CO/xanthine dehydrogenase FAD-binding subunit
MGQPGEPSTEAINRETWVNPPCRFRRNSLHWKQLSAVARRLACAVRCGTGVSPVRVVHLDRGLRVLHQPRDWQQALELKARFGPGIVPLAGGTDLLVALNRGQWRPERILDLKAIPDYNRIGRENGSYRLSAGATYSTISRLPVTALAQAALSIGGPQVRNRGTIGGNLATASPAGDGCVALLALDATIEIHHAARAPRLVPVRDFFLDYRRTALQPDELIAAVRIPADWTTAWYKIGKRSSVNISIVCCAIARSPLGRCYVALGCVGPYPMRALKTESLLNSAPLSPELIDDAARLVATEVSPIDDHRASGGYRRAMSSVLVKRLLTEHFVRRS